MKGLLLKDLYVMLANRKTLLYALVLGLVFTLGFKDNGTLFTMILGMIIMMLAYSTFTLDDQARWPVYALILPVKRRTIVAAKYLLVVFSAAAGMAIGALASIATYLLGYAGSIAANIATTFGILTSFLLAISVVLPLVFKFGIEKIRMVGNLVMLLPYFALLLVQLSNPNFHLPSLAPGAVIALCVVVAAAVVAVSFFAAVRLYARKQF